MVSGYLVVRAAWVLYDLVRQLASNRKSIDFLRTTRVITYEVIPCFHSAARRLPLLLAVLGLCFAVERWLGFHTLPRHAPVRFCGNCFLAAVGVPTELGMLGILLACGSLLKVPYRGEYLVCWWCAAAGVLFTPAVLGLPLFAFAFLGLMIFLTNTLFKRAAKVMFG
jgi:hypothetical protein